MARIIEEPYYSPDGTLDFPFLYVYDAGSLVDGSNVLSISKQLQGDSDFILRRIVGVPNCVATPANAGKFTYYDHNRRCADGVPNSGIILPGVWPVVPEKLYRVNDQITFSLFNILRSSNVCAEGTSYNSQIVFQGVKRYGRGSTLPRQITPYRYREVRYTYAYSLTINWSHFTAGGIVQPPQRFVQQMDNVDFELLGIRISQPGAAGALTTMDFNITLYDANNHAFSDAAVNQGYINSARVSASACSPYQSCFPTPTQLYPAGGAIVFDITSKLCISALPQSYEIDFDGLWRIPC
jgi:hypothetical protein